MFKVKSQIYAFDHKRVDVFGKVFTTTSHTRDTIGTFAHAEDAAQCVANQVQGAIVVHGKDIVWREGYEDQPAGESFDHAADVMYKRVDAYKVIASIPTGK